MPRVIVPLTSMKIKNAKPKDKDYKLTDGKGLYLLITKSGGKLWNLKYRFEGKEKKISLGAYPAVSLEKARKRRDEMKEKIADGIDPAAERKANKDKVKEKTIRELNTFQNITKSYFLKRNKLNEAYKVRLERSFENDVFPFIGAFKIDEIKPKDIIHIVKFVENRGAVESAHRLFSQINKVFKYAVSNQLVERNPCSEMDKAEILQSHTKKNYPTLTKPEDIKRLLEAIENYTGDYTVKMALKLAPYVFVRPFNLRFAEWNEIDFQENIWRIPKEKMKIKREHLVPLTKTTIELLREVQLYSGDAKYIFHSLRSKTTPMSDATLNNALRRMGFSKDELVVHGFRAMFSTIAHEKSTFTHEAIETQLAHSVGSQVSQAYNRAIYLDQRKELMHWWSSYLDDLKK